MRFLIKLIMKVHIKLWCWYDSWGEYPATHQAMHLTNAFILSMSNPGFLIPFLFGSFVSHQTMKSETGSWVPLLWKLMIALVFLFGFLDLLIALFAFCYVVVCFMLACMLLALDLWEKPEGSIGIIKNSYLREIWEEVDMEHRLYVLQNALALVEASD